MENIIGNNKQWRDIGHKIDASCLFFSLFLCTHSFFCLFLQQAYTYTHIKINSGSDLIKHAWQRFFFFFHSQKQEIMNANLLIQFFSLIDIFYLHDLAYSINRMMMWAEMEINKSHENANHTSAQLLLSKNLNITILSKINFPLNLFFNILFYNLPQKKSFLSASIIFIIFVAYMLWKFKSIHIILNV